MVFLSTINISNFDRSRLGFAAEQLIFVFIPNYMLIAIFLVHSLLEFFDKSKKWAEMCNLPQPFQRNLDALERNFAVSTFLFNNYFEPMFKNIYTDPADDPPRPPKSRKQR